MNGADLLCDTLLVNGVDVCFANPGTSEMHFCAALDRKPQMRCILGLFEGVVTGAADGYARMAEKPAATLLHTGPGLANGLANLHNARKARTPVINVVGDHASWHLPYDAPLTSDVGSLARPMSNWVRRIVSAEGVGRDTSDAYAAAMAMPGVATLILPADMAWSDIPATAPTRAVLPAPRPVAVHAVIAAAKALRSGRRVALHLSGSALRGETLRLAARIAAATGARLTAQNANGRIERGAGRPVVGRIPYTVDAGAAFMADVDILIRVGSTEPVTFFGYPGKPSRVTRADCVLMELAPQEADMLAALRGLADELGVGSNVPVPVTVEERIDASRLAGPLTGDIVSAIVAAGMPENAVICDESISSATKFYDMSQGSVPHDCLQITGGAIGIGTPLAAGAAVACPDRKVIGLQADGSALYTAQGLWTQARESLDVITIILNNGSYNILHGEMHNVGVSEFGVNARRMFNLDEPAIDWIALARGFGVEAVRATTAEDFRKAFAAGLARRGPFVIDAVI